MIASSLLSAAALLRAPAAWLPGIVLGGIAAGVVLVQYHFGIFLAERLLIIPLAVLPFFMAGLLHLADTGETSLQVFFEGGMSGYFRVLLPVLLVLFGIVLTILLILIPLFILGQGTQALSFLVMTVPLSILFFTFFSDTAAVFEGKPVFESIRRSVEFVLRNSRACLLFYLLSLGIAALIGFTMMLAWTAVLYERLVPLAGMTPEDMQTFTIADFNELLSADGTFVTALILFAGLAVAFSLLYAFKACFFRDSTVKAGEEEGKTVPLEGEYDSKGRYYRY